MLCVCTKSVCVRLTNWSAKQCDWLSHATPAPFPFPLFLFPGLNIYFSVGSKKHISVNLLFIITFWLKCAVNCSGCLIKENFCEVFVSFSGLAYVLYCIG